MKKTSEKRLINLLQLLFNEDSEVFKKHKNDIEELSEKSKKRILFVMETLAVEQISLLTAIEVQRESSIGVGNFQLAEFEHLCNAVGGIDNAEKGSIRGMVLGGVNSGTIGHRKIEDKRLRI